MKMLSFDSRRSLLLCLSLTTMTIGCGSTLAEAETDASSSSSSATTTGQPPGTTMPDPATTTPPDPSTTTGPASSSSSTEGADDSSSGSDFITKNDAGVDPMGTCVGFSTTGHLATVHSADGEGVQTQCNTTPAACGGDITGMWTFEEHCGLEDFPNFFESSCPGSTMAYVGSELSGSRMFAEDGTFIMDRSLVVDLAVELDTQACFGSSCEAFGPLFSDDELVLECVDAEVSGCDCTLQLLETNDITGTYETGDDGLTLTVNGVAGGPVDYCVADGELVIWESLSSSSSYPDTMCEDAADCERELGDIEDGWFCATN